MPFNHGSSFGGVYKSPLVKSVFVADFNEFDDNPAPPGSFLLLNNTPFILLNGQFFELLAE